MNVQNILWPRVGLCTEEKMFFRKDKKVQYLNEGELQFAKHGKAQFDTYFNGFSIDKWRKYTNIGKLSLKLKVQGKFKIQLFCKEKVHDDVFAKILHEELIETKELDEIILDFPDNSKGMLSFRIHSLSDDSRFYGGYYDSQIKTEHVRQVKLGIVICTYKREGFIENNINILNSALENYNSPLKGHLEVYISDNGQSLDIDRLKSNEIHIAKNKNAGGAGGFTRGLIEILNSNPKSGITHALLMDDDIIIEPESLIKTYNILSLIKDEYMDAFIGGAMLRIDKPNIQEESGASWNAGKLVSLKSKLDMNNCKSCLFNEVEEYSEFNAWWYCCIPISIVSSENLPMPIFIRGDDVEYGLRNMKHLILMNGICVWHEPFENKYSSFLSYYIFRNQLIDNAMHFPNYSKKQLKKDIRGSVFRELMYYRYKNVDLLLLGVKDYLKGIDWLLQSDGETLHKQIMELSYKAAPIDTLDMPFHYSIYKSSLVEKDNYLKRMIRLITVNGIFLPAVRDNIVSMAKVRPYNTYRVNSVMYYDVTTNKGFVCYKDIKEIIRCSIKLFELERIIDRKYDEVTIEYRERCGEVQNIKFWKRYLNI